MTTPISTLLWALLWLIGQLPLQLLYIVGSIFGWLLWRVDSKSSRIAHINIDYCFTAAAAQERRQLHKNFLLERGREIMLTAAILTRKATRLRQLISHVEGQDALHQALAEPAPVMLLNAHIGALLLGGCMPEYRATWFSQLQKGMFEPMLDRRRKSLPLSYVYTDTQGVRHAYRQLTKGGTVGIFCDHDPGQKGRKLIEFFGRKAYSSTLPAKLINKHNASAFFYLCIRNSGTVSYTLHIIPATASIYQSDITGATQAIANQLEDIIRHYPTHFDWCYERFRRANKGLYKPATRKAKQSG